MSGWARSQATTGGSPRPDRWLRRGLESAQQLLQRLDVVNGQHPLDVDQERPDAACFRLECGVAQQGVEPENAPAGPGKSLRLLGKQLDLRVLQAIGHEQ